MEELGLTRRVTLAGVTNNAEDVLRRADLFLHAARYEGSPNSVIEALAYGKCVIASNSPGGTAELLQNGRYGMLVPPDDIEAYAASMLLVMTNDELRKEIAAAASASLKDRSAALIARKWISHAS